MAFVDATHPAADPVTRHYVEAGVRVVAYGPHVESESLERLAALGADAVTRSKLFKSLGAFLPRQA